MIQIVGLFLIAMVGLAIAGRIRGGGRAGKRTGTCRACGRPRIGKGPCPCGKGGRG